MTSPYYFNLNSIKAQVNDAGSIAYVTSKEMPGLVNLSFCNLKLKPRGSTEPIWHPNAGKIGYCIDGKALVSIRAPSEKEEFTVKKGEIFFIPQGYIHHIENIDATDCVINFALNHSLPETMYFSKAISSISDSVFNGTFNTPPHFVDSLKKPKDASFIKTLSALKAPIPDIGSKYKFAIEGSDKAIHTKGGYLQVGTKTNLAVLQGLGILGFVLTPHGIVEPHWHTNAGELVYIVKGNTRITILSPDGHQDVLEVNAGEGAFAPASHFHNIENIGLGEVEVIAFFSHAEPNYIGIAEVLGSYSNELLSSVFNLPTNYFDQLKKTQKPLVIVPT